MGASTPEGKVKEKVKDFLKEARIWYFMPANNGYGTSGIPDFVCIVEGIFVGIECKADATCKPTLLQLARAREIREAGGSWHLIYDDLTLEDFKGWVAKNVSR